MNIAKQIVLSEDGLVEYIPGFITEPDSHALFNDLRSNIDWQHDVIHLFGKHITTKRKVAWYGDEAFAYSYSNSNKIALPWIKTLEDIKIMVNRLNGENFNSCLLNFYHTGSEAMGWHNDNETCMKPGATIASVSLGAAREFKFRHQNSGKQHSIVLENGSLLLMKAETQEFWKHQLPARKRILAPRINLTFRYFIDPSD
ncbi:MAG: alpha-ketoglutarate-dependent dioxygenase AlkB family protein [Oleiphilus sp.]